MLGKVKVENLPTYLAKIDRIFPWFAKGESVSLHDVVDYYRQSFWGYALFHSWSGAIHMAMSASGHFSKNDYLKQAEEIEDLLSTTSVDDGPRVLEVGCGRGFNLAYLASKFPRGTFRGMDITSTNVASAERILAEFPNARAEIGDFHDLAGVETASIDLVFAVETLCHSSEPRLAFQAIHRVLRPGGKLIVFDGFRDPAFITDRDVERAVTYTERAMAVPVFQTIADFEREARDGGFEAQAAEDRSQEIMPNLLRLSDLAKAFFKMPAASRLLSSLLPRGLVTNAVAGLLMAVTVQIGAHKYAKLIFERTA